MYRVLARTNMGWRSGRAPSFEVARPDAADTVRFPGRVDGAPARRFMLVEVNEVFHTNHAGGPSARKGRSAKRKETIVRIITDNDATIKAVSRGIKWARNNVDGYRYEQVSLMGHNSLRDAFNGTINDAKKERK